LGNVGFLRIKAEHLFCFFAHNEVAGIWITFPDPQPNKPRERKRLTSPRLLDIYRGFLKPDAPIHLKTDSVMLFDYTREIIAQEKAFELKATDDLYGFPNGLDPVTREIKTYYENIYLTRGEKICYLKFTL
jgi:tRNA (guanine-N7-)-methyltransferase